MSETLLEVRGLDLDTLDGRPLIRDLSLQLGREKVAVVGRNGVGKTTLLRVLAGDSRPTRGTVRRTGRSLLVAQELGAADESRGQRRRRALHEAWATAPDLLLLDEPTEDLDAEARTELLHRIESFDGGLIVVSHDAPLLACFMDFFVIAESGCHHFGGSYDALQEHLAAEEARHQQRYLQSLSDLADEEKRHHRVSQRRRRKRAVGRLHELDRCQSRARLGQRKSSAQVSQGRVRGMAESRIAVKRSWAHALRRALSVALPLDLAVPEPPEPDGVPVIELRGVTVERGVRTVVEGVDLEIRRERVAVVGPNGAGKTSLLRVMLRDLPAARGRVRVQHPRVGFIGQGAVDWSVDESLLERLLRTSDATDLEELAQRVVAHRFPLALAERSLASLSPGERTRAALICLFQQPGLEVLVLDEPTWSLDALGVRALGDVLRAWRGGLVVTSHDPAFLQHIGVTRWVRLEGPPTRPQSTRISTPGAAS